MGSFFWFICISAILPTQLYFSPTLTWFKKVELLKFSIKANY